ncbi:MAG: AraC family transcriptional regulator [Ignavibacteriales bacterium]|nr:AraC family transcriptional regulator [Ignavibacteriales bacterium]
MPAQPRKKHEKLTTTLYVKNMVCDRCTRVVREELTKIKLDVRSVSLGEVVVAGAAQELPMEDIKSVLGKNGFELIENRKAKTIEQMKLAIITFVREDRDTLGRKLRFPEYLSKKLGLEYHHLSTLFSSVENVTIEQFVILQRIERVKELLKYGELTLSEIAYKLGYSSVQHLSNQFKSVTGFTPTKFRSLTGQQRKPIDRVSRS